VFIALSCGYYLQHMQQYIYIYIVHYFTLGSTLNKVSVTLLMLPRVQFSIPLIT
jgi:hypothetical protein